MFTSVHVRPSGDIGVLQRRRPEGHVDGFFVTQVTSSDGRDLARDCATCYITGAARCRHCLGLSATECDGDSDTCPLLSLPATGAGLVASFAAVGGFLRLLTRIEPPEVRIQVTMQVLGGVLKAGRLCMFGSSGLCVARLQSCTISPFLTPGGLPQLSHRSRSLLC